MAVDLFGHPIEPPKRDFDAEVEEVWAFWLEHHAIMAASSYRLNKKRREKILAALKSHGLDVVKQAIEGVKESEWHMGKNGRGKRYNDVTTILRDDLTIERHAEAMAEDDEGFAGCQLEAAPGESWDDFNERRARCAAQGHPCRGH